MAVEERWLLGMIAAWIRFEKTCRSRFVDVFLDAFAAIEIPHNYFGGVRTRNHGDLCSQPSALLTFSHCVRGL
jgi:hypothetical protein